MFFCLVGGIAIVSFAIAINIYGKSDDIKNHENATPLVFGASSRVFKSPRSSLPPEAAPLTAIAPALIKAANSGRSDAAVRIFRDLSLCLANKREANFLANLHSDPDWQKSPDAYLARFGITTEKERQKTLADITEKIDIVEAYRDMCDGADEYFENGKIYQSLKTAAQTGDAQAIACMIAAPYEGPPLSNEDAADYRKTAYALGDQAIMHGSWAAVQALAEVHSREPNMSGYDAYVQRPDTKLQLQYTELLLKGVPPGSPSRIVMQQMVQGLSASLNPTDRIQAEEWAEDTYRNYFFFSGEADPTSSLCQQ
jgi:hypothetical protein